MQEPQEMWVQSLGQEEPLEEEMATHSSNPVNPTKETGRQSTNIYIHGINGINILTYTYMLVTQSCQTL